MRAPLWGPRGAGRGRPGMHGGILRHETSRSSPESASTMTVAAGSAASSAGRPQTLAAPAVGPSVAFVLVLSRRKTGNTDTGMSGQLVAAARAGYDEKTPIPTGGKTTMKRFHIAWLSPASTPRSKITPAVSISRRPRLYPVVMQCGAPTCSISRSTKCRIKRGNCGNVGFEDDEVEGYASSKDVNGLEWELFSVEEQDRRIVSTYGEAVRTDKG